MMGSRGHIRAFMLEVGMIISKPNRQPKLNPSPTLFVNHSFQQYTNHASPRAYTKTSCTRCPSENPASDASATLPPPDQHTAQDERCMRLALEQAQLAYSAGEVPVGAVIIDPSGTVVAAAHNITETQRDPTAHAEMLCIREASIKLNGWRLLDSTLYVTLEPCPMCAGALLQARVGRVVYGAKNSLLGADGSWINMMRPDEEEGGRGKRHPFHPGMKITPGVLREECSGLMKRFFKERRESGGE